MGALYTNVNPAKAGIPLSDRQGGFASLRKWTSAFVEVTDKVKEAGRAR